MKLLTPRFQPSMVDLFDDASQLSNGEMFVVDRLDIEDRLEIVYELVYHALVDTTVGLQDLHTFREFDIIDY